jgi:hypothetical protein
LSEHIITPRLWMEDRIAPAAARPEEEWMFFVQNASASGVSVSPVDDTVGDVRGSRLQSHQRPEKEGQLDADPDYHFFNLE